MKSFKKKASVVFAAAIVLPLVLVARGNAVIDPASVRVKVLELRLSPNADCSQSVSVFSDASPSYQDLVANPTFGAGSIAPGTYKCAMVHISDEVKYVPAANEGSCVQGTSYTHDMFRTGDTSVAPDGATISGHGDPGNPNNGVEDFPWYYFSVTGPYDANNLPANGAALGIALTPAAALKLASPLALTGSETVTFVMDYYGQIDGLKSNVFCDVRLPVIRFR